MSHPLRLFEGYGVELEYMIVDRRTLRVLPVCDALIKAFSGDYRDEVENGPVSWSNELALHVVELKTTRPAPALSGLADAFARNVRQIDALLAPLNGRLLPGAMHPFMDPHTEMHLWPHEKNEIYEQYNTIFDCRGHGWANLQSTHLNLPFGNDEEFGRLHAAVRLVLPLLPALAASSPVMDGRPTGVKDNRLRVYQSNQRRVPSISGRVVPEPVFTEDDYRREILARNYRDIAPFDPQGILQDEWLNSRGAIARFQRGAIEIRVLDIQECPAADLALLELVVATVRALTAERWTDGAAQRGWPVDPLYALFEACVTHAEDAPLSHADYLATFGYPGSTARAGQVWRYLLDTLDVSAAARPLLERMLTAGTLATRLERALGADPSPARMGEVYNRLADCLHQNVLFDA